MPRHPPTGSETLVLDVDAPTLAARLHAITGALARGTLRFDPVVPVDTGPGITVAELAEVIGAEMDRAGASPLLVGALRDALVTGLLTRLPRTQKELLDPSSRVAPGHVRKAAAYIDAHAGEAISLADIVGAAGVPARTLQAAFDAHHGCSPMQFLKEKRLELARGRLVAAEPGTTVAQVAAEVGMPEAGRFSVEYRKRFGESPSETLRRHR